MFHSIVKDYSIIYYMHGAVGVSDTVMPSKFLSDTVTKKGGLKEGFIVKYQNTDQLLGNSPSLAR